MIEVKARAVFEYNAVHPAEISITEGEMIVILEEKDTGWWKFVCIFISSLYICIYFFYLIYLIYRGRKSDGTEGLFPGNYVEKI